MKTKFTISLTILVLTISSLFAQEKVKMEIRDQIIPTYPVKSPDKNPIFFSGRNYQGAQGHIYPLPLYDQLSDNKVDKTYKSVFIENEFTEMCVIPELGGRIFSATDKSNGYDFFYRQHVIKPSLIGMIGAWISGGVEWNVPDHHRATSLLPINYTLEELPDGSKTVWVGETELSRGLKWTVGLTLHPGKSYIEATVKIFNPTPFLQSHLYFANVSTFCDENYQVIFPPNTQHGVQHAKNEFTTWPIGSGIYGDVDRSGVDLSLWKNHPNPASIFCWNFEDEFLAGYDFKQEAGTMHVANHHQVTGKKFFLWGNNPEAKMWEKMLTDTDGQYLELMVGAYSDNQPDYSWIAPGETRVFSHFWYPIRNIGGAKNATKEAAVNLERISTEKIKVGFNATSEYANAKVQVWLNGQILHQENVAISPTKPYLKELAVAASTKDTDIRVALTDAEGKELVSYQPVQLPKEEMPKPVEVPRDPKTYASNEELLLTGLRIEEFRNATIDPVPYYMEALLRDSLDYRTNTVMGIRMIKEGRFAEAVKYLDRAIKRATKDYTHPKDGEAFYYKGIDLQYQNRFKEAADELWKATWFNSFASVAHLHLAQMKSVEGQYPAALLLANLSLQSNSVSPEALCTQSFLLRKTGKTTEAKSIADQAVLLNQTDYWAFAEQAFGEATNGNWSDSNKKELLKKLGGNVQTLLSLALNYGKLGAYAEVINLLQIYNQSTEPLANFPMVNYYLGFFQLKTGDKTAAANCFAKAQSAPSDYCFPSRLEELDILKTAIAQNPADAKANYYLGNLCYFLKQKEEAISIWEKAVQADPSFALAWRNLGFAYSQVNQDGQKALAAFEKAIVANPGDPRYFAEADIIKERMGIQVAERLVVLEENRKTIEKHDDAISRLLLCYNLTGNSEKTVSMMQKRHFRMWEGGMNIHDVWVDAWVLKGMAELDKKQAAKALESFKQALAYPDNLEVGEPFDGGRNSMIYYHMAKASAKMKNTVLEKEYLENAATASKSRWVSGISYYKAMAMKQLGKTTEADAELKKLEDHASANLQSTEKSDFFAKFSNDTPREFTMAEYHYLLGLAQLGKGNAEAAKASLSKAVQLNPNHIWAKMEINQIQ